MPNENDVQFQLVSRDKRVRIHFKNLKSQNWEIFHEKKKNDPYYGSIYYSHPEENIVNFVQPSGINIWIDLRLNDFKKKTKIWFKFKHKKIKLFYKYEYTEISEIKFIPRIKIEYLQSSPYNRPPSTTYANNARPVFKIENIDLLKQVDIFLISTSNQKTPIQFNFNEEKNFYFIAPKNNFKKNIDLFSTRSYRIRFIIKNKYKNLFFSKKDKDGNPYRGFSDGKQYSSPYFTIKQARDNKSEHFPKLGIEKQETLPKTSTAKNGFFIFNLEKFNSQRMKIHLLLNNNKSDSQLLIPKQIPNPNPRSRKQIWQIKVKNLRSGQKFKLKFLIDEEYLKRYPLAAWRRSVTPHEYTESFQMGIQNKTGLLKPHISSESINFRPPITKNFNNGSLRFKIQDYNPDKMGFEIISNIKSESLNSSKLSDNSLLVEDLQGKEIISMRLFLKNVDDVWTDGTQEDIIFSLGEVPESSVEGLEQPTFNIVEEINSKTSSSKDAELKIQINNFDDNKMNMFINVDRVQISKIADNLWKISKLQNDQKIEIKIKLKENNFWNTKNDIAKPIIFNIITKKVDYEGINKIEIIEDWNNSISPKTFTSSDGELLLKIKSDRNFLNKNEIKEFFEKINYKFLLPNIKLNVSPLNIINLKHDQEFKLIITPKANHYWKDGSQTSFTFTLRAPKLNADVVEQPKVLNTSIKNLPSSDSTNDGSIQIDFDNFDHVKLSLTSNIGIVKNFSRNSVLIEGISSGQKINIKIVPKKDYAWRKDGDVSIDPLFLMPKILDFPKLSDVEIESKDPYEIGGKGYVHIKKINLPKYKGETETAAYLQYQENNMQWKKVPNNGIKLEGKNGYLIKFKWTLNNGYRWSQNSNVVNPPTIVLKNPGAASVPKIEVKITQISKPKGQGSIRVNPFIKPNGATLQYKINEETDWKDMDTSGQYWEGRKDGFKIEFRWVLNEGFVWDENQPQKIINAVSILKDPIDNEPPEWKFKNSLTATSQITKENSKLYRVNLEYYYDEKILLNDIINLFEARDKYGIYSPSSHQHIFSSFSEITVKQNYLNAITLKAFDLAGNESELIINILIKYKIEDLSNAKIDQIKFENSFSGYGELLVNNRGIPAIVFKDAISNNLININNKNVFAIYRLVDKDGEPISWTNNEKERINGWSKPDKTSGNALGTNYPKMLYNGQIIQIKFIPKEGYKIRDYISKEEALLKKSNPQLLSSSRIFQFKVDGLIEKIEKLNEEPKYSFSGNDGQGKVKIVPNSKQETNISLGKTKYLVQIFRPYLPENVGENVNSVDKDGNPIYGFEIYIPIKNTDMGDNANWHLVSGVTSLTSIENLDANEIRKLWKDFDLSMKINSVQDMIYTFIEPQVIDKLYNFYSMRIIEKVNRGWGYKYKNSNQVNEYPQEFTKKIIWKQEIGKIYLGKKVENLSINPLINIMDKSFFLEIKPSLKNAYTYEKDMRLVLSYYPSIKKADKFIWKYKILNEKNEIISPYSNDINIKSIKNGYKLVVAYEAIPPFTLSETFSKMERVFLIEGLKIKIDISSVPNPKLVFSGTINHGTIIDLIENDLNNKQKYDRSLDFPIPQVKSQKIKVKWQYRVFPINPNEVLENQKEFLDKFKWSDNIPTNLNNNHYVQVRIAPIDSDKYGVEPQIYSIDVKTNSPFVQVHDLEINIELLQNISFEIFGDANQNIIKILNEKKQKDYQQNFKALIFEAKSQNSNSWKPLSFFNNKLKNKMILSFRAYAKNPQLAKLPNANNNKLIKIINGKKYLEFTNWKNVAIDGLKITIRFDYIDIKQPVLAAMKKTPWKEVGKSPEDLVIPSGWAEIINQVVNSEYLNNAFYEKNNKIINARNQIEVQYQLLEYDKPTNKIFSRGWSTIPPNNLKNKDQIQIRITPKDPKKFQLDWKREITFKVKNLYEYNKKIEIQPPKMIFSGIDGKGIGMPEISVPHGYTYFYQIYNEKSKLIEDWSQNLPKNLKNNYYIKSRITKNKNQINNSKSDSVDSTLQKVYGLFSIYLFNNFKKIYLEIRIVGKINHKAYLYINESAVQRLKQNNYRIEYIVYNKINKEGKRYLKIPNNLSNGDEIEIEIFNKRTGENYNLKQIKTDFKKITVSGLVDDEQHTKTMSKAIWIPAIVFSLLLLFTIPVYIVRRKRKLLI